MELLSGITIIIIIAVVAALVCHKLGIPSIVGFLLTGVVAGPHVLGVVRAAEQIKDLSEIGVVLLLFVIGLELSVSGLMATRRQFLVGGSIQLFGTAVVVGVATYLILDATLAQSGFLGAVVALSSTAIVLRLLQERAELESPHGRMVLGTLIYQDIAVVPLMLVAPLLAGAAGTASSSSVAVLLIRIVAVGLGAWIAYRWVVPWLLFQIARTHSREAFLLGVLAICATIALLTQEAGLSLALGAFLAGLIISESEYSHQAVGVILPFRDVFMCLFFVSVGMQLDVAYLLQHPGLIVALTLGVLVIKPLIGAVAAIASGLPLRNAVLAGMALGQIGEFSLVATQAGVASGLLGGELFQIVLDTVVLSMLAAPLLFALAPRTAETLQRMPWTSRLRSGFGASLAASAHNYARHIVIVGFGVTGKNVARAAIEAGVDYAAIDISAETVRSERRAGMHLHYGDATTDAILHYVNAEKALVVVVAVNDPAAARRITELSRRIAPNAFILVRSRYLTEIEALHILGADEVIADELEVSIEIFSRVLARCLVPREEIESFVDDVRAEWRDMARSLSPAATAVHDLRVEIPDLATYSFRLTVTSPLAGLTIAESGLRVGHGVTVLAVKRGNESIGNPVGATNLEIGDVLFVIGPREWDPGSVS
ncbi:MAG: potassium transporter KefB [Coriobacteriia bacterium]|nr:potassium transporter KefB [Coriobacteriia bacterium]